MDELAEMEQMADRLEFTMPDELRVQECIRMVNRTLEFMTNANRIMREAIDEWNEEEDAQT